MSDLIRIIDLEVRAQIGITDAERARSQRLLLSLEISIDTLAQAAATDNIAHTLNYFSITQRIKTFVGKRPRNLIETLAEDISTDILGAYPIQKLTLEIKKFILPDTRYVSVLIERTKK